MKAEQEYLYERVAGDFRRMITAGVLLRGDKLPSIRGICQQYKVSKSTALQAYTHLETQGFIRPVEKSGYYVAYLRHQAALPGRSNPAVKMGNEDTADIVTKVYDGISSDHIMLSLGVPAITLLPVAKLNRELRHAINHTPDSGTGYEHVLGSANLRRQIARMSPVWGGQLNEEDIMATAGCTGAMTHSLMALTARGDTIAVESPVYFGILQLAKNLGLNVLELPSHPETGVEVDALKTALSRHKVKLCLLVSNFSNPMGGTIPLASKKEIVKLITRYNVPLIENDMYGDLYFGDTRPVNCKAFDEEGLVLLCSSVSKTLAPGYRVGWVTPGKFAAQLRRVKFASTLSATAVTQQAVAGFLEKGHYEKHMKVLRNTLHHNSLKYIDAITNHFPEGTKVSRPAGGFMLWLELDKQVDTAALYDKAIKMKVSIAPGRMFSLHNQYNNCMRLSFGMPWDQKTERAIKTIANLI